jgi:hypothetical protein
MVFSLLLAVGCWSKIDVYFLSNEIEVALLPCCLLLFYPMGLKLTSSNSGGGEIAPPVADNG